MLRVDPRDPGRLFNLSKAAGEALVLQAERPGRDRAIVERVRARLGIRELPVDDRLVPRVGTVR